MNKRQEMNKNKAGYKMQEITAVKNELRRCYSRIRNEITTADRDRWSQQACDFMIQYIQDNGITSIMVYIPFRSEINTWPLIEWCWSHQIQVLVPLCIVETHTMNLFKLKSREELVVGAYSILEPNPLLAEHATKPPNVVVVPGLAFTATGERLGYGGGYYDRYYSAVQHLPIEWIGIGYHDQITSKLPMQDNDIRLTSVITNRGIMTSLSKDLE